MDEPCGFLVVFDQTRAAPIEMSSRIHHGIGVRAMPYADNVTCFMSKNFLKAAVIVGKEATGGRVN